MPGNDPDREIRDELKNDVKRGLESEPASVFSQTEVLRTLMDRVRFWDDRHRSNLVRDLHAADISRRRFLKLLGFGLTGAAIGASGAGAFMGQRVFEPDGTKSITGYLHNRAGENVEVNGWNFTVVDATDYINKGGNADDAVHQLAQDKGLSGNLLVFPEGEYAWTDTHAYGNAETTKFISVKGKNNFGIIGDGKVVFKPESSGTFNSSILNCRNNDKLVFKDLVLDQQADDVITGFQMGNMKNYLIENVNILGHGRHPQSTADRAVLEANGVGTTLHAGTTGVIKNFVAINDGYNYDDHSADQVPAARMGVWCGSGSPGDLEIIDCDIEGMPNNGLYTCNVEGAVRVKGGLYRNNNVGSVRIGSSTSVADGVMVENDPTKSESPDTHGEEHSAAFQPQHKPRLSDSGGPTFKNCHVRLRGIKGLGAFIGLSGGLEGETRFKNVTMDIDAPQSSAIVTRNKGSTTLVLENVHIAGKTADGTEGLKLGSLPTRIQNSCINWEGAKAVSGSNIRESDYATGSCRAVKEFPGYKGTVGSYTSTGTERSSANSDRTSC